jgi:outer membrane protein TolC
VRTHSNRTRLLLPFLLSFNLAAQQNFAASEVSIATPPQPRVIGWLLRPFHLEKRQVAPAKLTNSPRLNALIRGGNLYLSVDDVIALAIENNLDIAIQRYGPVLARESLRRTEGGGLLRSDIQIPVAAGPVSVSTLGVSGNASGLATGSAIGSTSFLIGSGPNPPSLDPNFSAQATFGHSTQPQTNLGLNSTTSLVNSYRQYYFGYSQQFLTGSAVALSYGSSRSFLNSPNPTLNPAVSGYLDLTFSQSLLQGFSRAVNDRQIRVARNNLKATNLTVKLQLITTIAAVLNLYWDLVVFNEDVRIKQQALATAERLLEDNKKRVQEGALPALEVTRAAAQVSQSEENLLIARTNLAQQETVLKNALSRTGVQDPAFDQVHVVPLDSIQVPKTDEIRPIQDLIQTAIASRPEIEQAQVNLKNSKINLQGTRNALLPSLGVYADFTNNALGGALNPIYNNCCGAADPYFIGGAGNNLLEMFRRNFPSYSAGFQFNIPLRNRASQADYAMDQLKLRTEELQLQRSLNQIRVEMKNAVIGLQQARVRYETAVNTRVLAEQTLDAEQKRFQYGATGSDVTTVIQAQQDLANDQSLEVQAMAAYTHAKIAYDQALGQTLDVNHIKWEEAISGRVERDSVIPEILPGPKR